MTERVISMNATAAYPILSSSESTARPLHKPQHKPERLPQAPARPRAKQVRAKPAISLLTFAGTVIAAVLFFGLLFNYVQLYEVQSEVSALQQEQQSLRLEQQRLKLEYEESIDLDVIRERALALGLREPLPSQVVYLSVETNDTAQIYTAPEERNIFEKVCDAFVGTFRDVVEYFS